MDNAKGKRLAQMRTQAKKESGKFRGRATKYRHRIEGIFTRRREREADMLADELGLVDALFTGATPRA